MKIGVIGATGLVGSQLVARAQQRCHETVGVSRSLGHDLCPSPGWADGLDLSDLGETLDGCAAVGNVLQCPDLAERAATDFFAATTSLLAEGCSAAGVKRTVLLSIIGVDGAASLDADPAPATPEGYYRAKHAQEQLTQGMPGEVHVLRSAPFHSFVGQVLGRAAESMAALVSDMPVQPVEPATAVDLLIDLATGGRTEPVLEVAGPRVERLVEIAREFADYYFEDQEIRSVPASKALTEGLLIPGPSALIGGCTFHEWLHSHARG